MSLNVAYLDQLSAFTKFANDRINVSDKNAVACITQDGGNVQEISKNSLDKPYAFFPLVRSRANKQMNNETRALFKNTIANLFGGEDKIPQSVKDAMHFDTFDGKGHPLTAKRINITKNAILKAIENNPFAGISEGDAMRKLNGHESDQIGNESIDGNSLTNTNSSINDAGDEDNNIINTNTIKEAPKPQGNTQTQQTVKKGGIYDNPAFKAMNGKMMHNLPVGGTPQDVQKALNPNSGTKIVVEHKSDDEILDMKPVQQGKKPKAKKPKFFTE